MKNKNMNLRISFTLSLSIILIYSSAFCQSGTLQEPTGLRSSLAASIGINDFHQRDYYLSPYVFNGLNFASKLAFQVLGKESMHNADAFFSYGALNSEIQPRYVRKYVASLSYSYVHSVAKSELAGNPLQISVGGGISSYFMFTDFNTTDEKNYITYDQSWYWSHTLNLVLLGGYEFDAEKYLAIRLTFPVTGFVSRPENERWMSQNNSEVTENYFNAATQGKIDFVWNNFVLFTDIEYRQSLSTDFDFLATYRFGYVSSRRPAPILSINMYMNNLLVGIAWSI